MKNIWSWIGIIILIAALGFGGYYGWQQRGTLLNTREELNTMRNQIVNQNNSLQNQISNNLGNNLLPTNNTPGTVCKQENLAELWQEYANYKLGFSIWYPKTVAAAQGMDIYGQFVSIQIIEDAKNNKVYIGTDYKADRESFEGFGGLPGRRPAIEKLFGGPFWVITIKPVKSESELKSFIAANYGSDCKINMRSSYPGDPEVEKIILSNPDPNRGSVGQNPAIDCDFGQYEILYDPYSKKAMAIDMTNEAVFHAQLSGGIAYDQMILDYLISFNRPTF